MRNSTNTSQLVNGKNRYAQFDSIRKYHKPEFPFRTHQIVTHVVIVTTKWNIYLNLFYVNNCQTLPLRLHKV